MSKGKTDNAIRRQWNLLKLLPHRGTGLAPQDIAMRYADSQGETFDPAETAGKNLVRKIQRDLGDLESADLVVCNAKSKPHGWRLNENLAYFSQLSGSEALFLALSEQTITPLLPPNMMKPLRPVFDKAKSLIDEQKKISPPLRKRIIHAPVLPLIPPTIDDVVLETVHQAVATNKIISVSYQATYRNDPKEMNLHVWGLFQNAPSTYMIARKDGTKSPRFFALHRIKSIRLTTLGADIPKDFNISKMLNSGELHFGNEGLIELHLMVRPIIANILEQTPLSENQELSSELINWGEEEGILLKANVNLTWELRFWILSQGSNVEVIKPTKLRNSISKELRACVNRYQ